MGDVWCAIWPLQPSVGSASSAAECRGFLSRAHVAHVRHRAVPVCHYPLVGYCRDGAHDQYCGHICSVHSHIVSCIQAPWHTQYLHAFNYCTRPAVASTWWISRTLGQRPAESVRLWDSESRMWSHSRPQLAPPACCREALWRMQHLHAHLFAPTRIPNTRGSSIKAAGSWVWVFNPLANRVTPHGLDKSHTTRLRGEIRT